MAACSATWVTMAISIMGLFARLTEGVVTFGAAYVVLKGRSPYPVLAVLSLSALLASIVALAELYGLQAWFGSLIPIREGVVRISGTLMTPITSACISLP